MSPASHSSRTAKTTESSDFPLQNCWLSQPKEKTPAGPKLLQNPDPTLAYRDTRSLTACAGSVYPEHMWARSKRQRYMKVWQVAMISLGHPPIRQLREQLLNDDEAFSADYSQQKLILVSWMVGEVERAGQPLVVDHTSNTHDTAMTNHFVDAYVGLSLLFNDKAPSEHPAMPVYDAIANLSPQTGTAHVQERRAMTASEKSEEGRRADRACVLVYVLTRMHYQPNGGIGKDVAERMSQAVVDVLGQRMHGFGRDGIEMLLKRGCAALPE